MMKFFENLENALTAAKIDCSIIGHDNTMIRLGRYTRNGNKGFTEIIQMYPAKNIPHHFIVEEIWKGKEKDGSPWSDHMGGFELNLENMKCSEAIAFIVSKVESNMPNWFNA